MKNSQKENFKILSNVPLTNAGKSNTQSGLRSNYSTSTTLHDVQDYILKNMDSGYVTGVLFLDITNVRKHLIR